eukprot:SAG31_NODE_8220_length_1494_cov_1.324731_3_plen_163_part_01
MSGTIPAIGQRCGSSARNSTQPNPKKVMTSLRLGAARVSGTLGSHFFHLPELQFLSLETTSVSGTLPPGTGNLSSVVEFNLQGCRVSGTLPYEMAMMSRKVTDEKGLQIDLSRTKISGSIPGWLGNMPTLGSLFIDYSLLSGHLRMESMRYVRQVSLRGNKLF